jgi:hypothetical protein
MRRVAGASIAVLAVLAWVAPASAAPQQRAAVSESSPQVSFGTDGNALVSWTRVQVRQSTVLEDSGAPGEIHDVDVSGQFVEGPAGHRAYVGHSNGVIGITRLNDDGLVESTATINAPGSSDAKAVFDVAGRMTVTWEVAPGAGDSAVYAVRTNAQGDPGPVSEVFPDRTTLDWSIATDSQGRTVVARLATGRMDVVTLDANGVPGPMTQLANNQAGFPSVAIDSQDRPTIAWEEGPSWDPQAIRMRRVESDGSLGPVHTLGEGDNIDLLGVGFDAAGGGTALLRLPSPNTNGGSIALARIGADGSPGPVRAVAPPTNLMRWGLDDLGRTRIAWEKEGRVETLLVEPDGTPGGVRTITEMQGSTGLWNDYLDMDTDAQGRAVIAWTKLASYPTGVLGPIEAVRVAADGSFGQIHQISRGDQSPPELSLMAMRKQKFDGAVRFTASCDEFCRFLAGGSVLVMRRSKGKWKPKARIPLRGFDDEDNLCRPYGNQCAKDLRLVLGPTELKRAQRALKRGRWLVATINVEAVDRAGLTDTVTQEIRLKRRAPKAR